MSDLQKEIEKMIDERVEKALEEKLPVIIRALGIREAESTPSAGYIDALEVAKLLGKDVSSPENIRKAKKHVYHLAAQNLIPSVRITERNIKFDRAKVLKALEAKENRAA